MIKIWPNVQPLTIEFRIPIIKVLNSHVNKDLE